MPLVSVVDDVKVKVSALETRVTSSCTRGFGTCRPPDGCGHMSVRRLDSSFLRSYHDPVLVQPNALYGHNLLLNMKIDPIPFARKSGSEVTKARSVVAVIRVMAASTNHEEEVSPCLGMRSAIL